MYIPMLGDTFPEDDVLLYNSKKEEKQKKKDLKEDKNKQKSPLFAILERWIKKVAILGLLMILSNNNKKLVLILESSLIKE